MTGEMQKILRFQNGDSGIRINQYTKGRETILSQVPECQIKAVQSKRWASLSSLL